MSRYRAPRPPSSKYITVEGAARLQQELDNLWHVRRPAVTQAVSEAAAQGDRSENAEYIYGKKQLREIDRRVRYLRHRLDGIHVVSEPPSDISKVYFGAWFDLIEEDGTTRRCRLVGADEIGFVDAYISLDSPLGKAIRGKSEGDVIIIETPGGERQYEVAAITYSGVSPVDKKMPGQAGQRTGESQ